MSKIDQLVPLSGVTVSGAVGSVNAARPESFVHRVMDSGFMYMFEDWSRTDTYAVIGILFTFISIKQTAEIIRLRKSNGSN